MDVLSIKLCGWARHSYSADVIFSDVEDDIRATFETRWAFRQYKATLAQHIYDMGLPDDVKLVYDYTTTVLNTSAYTEEDKKKRNAIQQRVARLLGKLEKSIYGDAILTTTPKKSRSKTTNSTPLSSPTITPNKGKASATVTPSTNGESVTTPASTDKKKRLIIKKKNVVIDEVEEDVKASVEEEAVKASVEEEDVVSLAHSYESSDSDEVEETERRMENLEIKTPKTLTKAIEAVTKLLETNFKTLSFNVYPLEDGVISLDIFKKDHLVRL
jgi:hypothetical protein